MRNERVKEIRTTNRTACLYEIFTSSWAAERSTGCLNMLPKLGAASAFFLWTVATDMYSCITSRTWHSVVRILLPGRRTRENERLTILKISLQVLLNSYR